MAACTNNVFPIFSPLYSNGLYHIALYFMSIFITVLTRNIREMCAAIKHL